MKEILQILEEKNTVLVTDFDKTMTLSGSSMNSVVNVLGKDSGFAEGRNELFKKYGWCRSAEESQAVQAKETAQKWWKEQMELFLAWDIAEDVLKKTASILPPREEMLLLLKKCEKNKKNVWIVSSGLENVIQYWLEYYQISAEKIRILANRLFYADGHSVGYGELITDWNKKERFSAVWKMQGGAGFPVFLGDRQGDLDLVEPSVGFLIL